ncbi:MAG: ABC transporter permease [Thaumarchaeota archaeon]|nr:ABC transporter permease [Nitrososphaerota archaeon]
MKTLRAIVASAWVGWEREIGWTNPVAGILVRTAPITAAVLTAAMVYWFGSSRVGVFSPERLAFVIVGSSLYAHVGAYAWLPTSAIAEGKWSNVFTHVYITSTSSIPYLFGRGVAAFLSSVPMAVFSLVAAYFFAQGLLGSAPAMTASPASILMLLGALIVDFPAAMGLGFILASHAIIVGKFEWALPTYIAGVLMIFSEALFPASVLPWPLSLIAEALPFTYFIRASRAALIYGSWDLYVSAMVYALPSSLVLLFLGLMVFKWGEKKGRQKGLIDRKVG